MIPWVHLETAVVPGDGGQLRLMRRGAEFSIMLGGNELMNSRLGGSEEALATLACDKIRGRAHPHVLIGGLGMGFTLRAALAVLGDDAKITVAELMPAVVAWAKGPMADVFRGSLADPRAAIVEEDVGIVIRAGRSSYDAILLDVDNGPEGLTSKTNDALYEIDGLQLAYAALRTGGALAVWSSGPSRGFAARLRKTGFEVAEITVRATAKNSGARHIIWIATRPTDA